MRSVVILCTGILRCAFAVGTDMPVVIFVGSPLFSEVVSMIVRVLADVTKSVIVGIHVRFFIKAFGDCVSTVDNLSMSVVLNNPVEGVLVVVIPGAAVTDSVVIGVSVLANVLNLNVVALGSVPMISLVVIPFLIILVRAHYVSALVTDSVVFFFGVNVCRSVRFYRVVTAV